MLLVTDFIVVDEGKDRQNPSLDQNYHGYLVQLHDFQQ